MYTYAPHPKCSKSSQDCQSPFLFCNLNAPFPRCVAKIKPGGRCDGFEREDACFGSVCIDSRCRVTDAFQKVIFAKFKTVSRNEYH